MRFLVVLAFASVAFTGSMFVSGSDIGAFVEENSDDYLLDLEESDEEGDIDLKDIFANTNQRGLIASWQGRILLREFIKQMPCGWPQYGIPPLAPYKLREQTGHIQYDFFDILYKVFHLRVDGLNNILIKHLKVNLISKKIKFDFIFPKISITAEQFATNSTFDALGELGVFVQYIGDGSFNMDLENLRAAGKMKGKIPLLYGSAKLLSLKTEVTLEKCTADITGLAANSAANEFFNRLIEKYVETIINSHTQQISDIIEEIAKHEINPRLKGKDFWSLLSFILNGNGNGDGHPIVSNCVPPANTWD